MLINIHILNCQTMEYDKVSAIVQISLPLAAYFDIPQIAVKIDFFKQNHQLRSYFVITVTKDMITDEDFCPTQFCRSVLNGTASVSS